MSENSKEVFEPRPETVLAHTKNTTGRGSLIIKGDAMKAYATQDQLNILSNIRELVEVFGADFNCRIHTYDVLEAQTDEIYRKLHQIVACAKAEQEAEFHDSFGPSYDRAEGFNQAA